MARRRTLALLLAIIGCGFAVAVAQAAERHSLRDQRPRSFRRSADTATPIRHLAVIFQENVSFDHYFGTYPHATNPSGEPVIPRGFRHPGGQRALRGAADEQSQRRQPPAARPLPGPDL
jgi:phospholipase C